MPPGDPYEALRALSDNISFTRPSPLEMAQIARGIGLEHFKPIAPPPQEAVPRWRRFAEGLRHSKTRDAEVIHHHYDVSNTFYEWVLGPSMTPRAPCTQTPTRVRGGAGEQVPVDLREAAPAARGPAARHRLRLGRDGPLRRTTRRQGDRCDALAEQAQWAQRAIVDEGLGDLAEVRHSDYRDVAESGFDAVSSIGLTEHIGVSKLPGVLLVHARQAARRRLDAQPQHHPPGNTGSNKAGAFIDRYVFPDGELTGAGTIIRRFRDVGGLGSSTKRTSASITP